MNGLNECLADYLGSHGSRLLGLNHERRIAQPETRKPRVVVVVVVAGEFFTDLYISRGDVYAWRAQNIGMTSAVIDESKIVERQHQFLDAFVEVRVFEKLRTRRRRHPFNVFRRVRFVEATRISPRDRSLVNELCGKQSNSVDGACSKRSPDEQHGCQSTLARTYSQPMPQITATATAWSTERQRKNSPLSAATPITVTANHVSICISGATTPTRCICRTATQNSAIPIRDVLAGNVRAYRARRQLSQEKLAELSESHQTYISAIELGTSAATVDVIERVAAALDVPGWKLLIPEKEP